MYHIALVLCQIGNTELTGSLNKFMHNLFGPHHPDKMLHMLLKPITSGNPLKSYLTNAAFNKPAVNLISILILLSVHILICVGLESLNSKWVMATNIPIYETHTHHQGWKISESPISPRFWTDYGDSDGDLLNLQESHIHSIKCDQYKLPESHRDEHTHEVCIKWWSYTGVKNSDKMLL